MQELAGGTDGMAATAPAAARAGGQPRSGNPVDMDVCHTWKMEVGGSARPGQL
jgi:hypothetical protein